MIDMSEMAKKLLSAGVQRVVIEEAEKRGVEAPVTLTRFNYDIMRDMHIVRVDLCLGVQVVHGFYKSEDQLVKLSLPDALNRLGPTLAALYARVWPPAQTGDVIDVEARVVHEAPALGLQEGGAL